MRRNGNPVNDSSLPRAKARGSSPHPMTARWFIECLLQYPSRKAEQPCRIVGEDQLARCRIRRPFAEQIVELDRADTVVERQMREVAAPDQLPGCGGDERMREGLHVGEAERGRESISAGQLHPAAPRAVAG